jgi:hypothetical protein
VPNQTQQQLCIKQSSKLLSHAAQLDLMVRWSQCFLTAACNNDVMLPVQIGWSQSKLEYQASILFNPIESSQPRSAKFELTL